MNIKLNKTITKSARYKCGEEWKWQHIEMNHNSDYLLFVFEFNGFNFIAVQVSI